MGFVIRFKGLSAADGSAYAPHLTSHLIFLISSFICIILSTFNYDRSFDQQGLLTVSDYSEFLFSGAQHHVTPHLTLPLISY